MRVCICFFLIISYCESFAQQANSILLKNILQHNHDSVFEMVLQHPEIYRYQIIYTQINRDKNNKPSFTNYYLDVDSNLYFNPASMVKLPLAFLSLEKLHSMHIKGVNKYTPALFDSSYSHQSKEYTDSTAENNLPSIAQFIRKAFLISDNDAYNRMYEFVGQETINRQLHAKGYHDARIIRQFAGMNEDENRHTNAIRFLHKDGSILYTQPMAFNKDSFNFSHTIKLGNAHYDNNDSLIHEPMDFTKQNNISLHDLQLILQSIMFPSSVPPKQRFNVGADDYIFLRQFLSQYPSETEYPKYDTSHYYDSYVKFFFRNPLHTMPAGIRVFNKVGWSYGFLTDVSYVVDFNSNIEFMLSANIYVNSDGVLNDDKYDYDSIGWPFLYELGQTIYKYELSRNRKYAPALDNFKLSYGHRNPASTRLSIKAADN